MHPPATEPQAVPPIRPPIRQLALQLAAVFVVLSLAWPYYGIRNEELPWPQIAFAIAGVAILLASLTRQPWWWRLIHAVFAPLAWCVSTLEIDPGWFLLAFCLLLLVYRGALTGQIPLYLSSRASTAALLDLTAGCHDLHFLDLGAGIGSVLIPLARARPDAHFTGVENAPATWLAGRLRTARLNNCDWHWGDIWRYELHSYNVVYAFLSPAPMSALWQKVRREMHPGSLFVSNNFSVPDVEPSSVIEVGDERRTLLYCYRI
ncbi:MAG TPA: class I SAM-dependent methyltransferase [Accumulibacter sp.]|uniref:class I SAM-dependent methyltransferase n=1 Tax=Accumulibacter sp. TaxID=2053492 RepID=UPI0025ECD497|nr:class I SAM-dependent methyltransferase [Accumulibacter sp.]MCM8599375.1 class I SAM-dependent methyltransferase [Accumulibacter sp.]MCM8661810.1 class I SAM-dependent methyltransferase [Accumulibacter sp.]HNC51581.1 class I SAM-dependent methyltransferase [Accumulibacter sp.]